MQKKITDIIKLVKNQNGISSIIVVILMVLSIGGYLIYRNQNNNLTQSTNNQIASERSVSADEVASWELYTNVKNGYSIKYPPELRVEHTATEDLVIFVLKTAKGNKGGVEIKDPQVVVAILKGDIEERYNALKAEREGTDISKVSRVEVDGHKAFRVDEVKLNRVGTLIENGDSLIAMDAVGPLTENPEFVNIYHKMISTFRFTNR